MITNSIIHMQTLTSVTHRDNPRDKGDPSCKTLLIALGGDPQEEELVDRAEISSEES